MTKYQRPTDEEDAAITAAALTDPDALPFNVIDDSQWALTWDEDAGYVFMMPHAPDEDEELPQEAQVLAALFRRVEDPQFVQEQLDWLRDEGLRLGLR